jgi:DNA-binding HxlR family transcriptional regulator
MQRERKVLEKMKSSGVFKIEELLPLVYDDVDRRLFPLAIRSLEAHLRKLEKDGIVNKDQENWVLV